MQREIISQTKIEQDLKKINVEFKKKAEN